VREIMTRPCPTCHGDGVVLSEETVAIEFERRLRELASRAPRNVEAFLVRMNPHVSSEFTGNQSRVLHALEAETGKHFHFTAPRASARPLRRRARGLRRRRARGGDSLPRGDEVLVTIIEPHMYAVDDAVAKVDGYIISVANGGAHVGEKRLVRIEEAGRTSATAVLVDDHRSPNGSGAEKPERKPAARGRPGPRAPSRRRPSRCQGRRRSREAGRRGRQAGRRWREGGHGRRWRRIDTPAPRRRGGRRRSAAKAETTSAD